VAHSQSLLVFSFLFVSPSVIGKVPLCLWGEQARLDYATRLDLRASECWMLQRYRYRGVCGWERDQASTVQREGSTQALQGCTLLQSSW